MNTSPNSAVLLLGRILLSVIFLFSGTGQISEFSQNVSHVAAAGMLLPQLAIDASIVVQILCGLAILLGFRIRIAAWVLFLFLIPTTVMLHKFWGVSAPHLPEIQFFKNMAIMGGLLFVASSGAGVYSVDGVLSRKCFAAP